MLKSDFQEQARGFANKLADSLMSVARVEDVPTFADGAN